MASSTPLDRGCGDGALCAASNGKNPRSLLQCARTRGGGRQLAAPIATTRIATRVLVVPTTGQ